jgi:hypothetical protein
MTTFTNDTNNTINQFLLWVGEVDGELVRVAAREIIATLLAENPNYRLNRLDVRAKAKTIAFGLKADKIETGERVNLIASVRDR